VRLKALNFCSGGTGLESKQFFFAISEVALDFSFSLGE
jgi:hypothetical protein